MDFNASVYIADDVIAADVCFTLCIANTIRSRTTSSNRTYKWYFVTQTNTCNLIHRHWLINIHKTTGEKIRIKMFLNWRVVVTLLTFNQFMCNACVCILSFRSQINWIYKLIVAVCIRSRYLFFDSGEMQRNRLCVTKHSWSSVYYICVTLLFHSFTV